MHVSKTRYVTFCQQLLVTACVLATAVAAAGVVSLDIVETGARRQHRGPRGRGR